MEQFKIKNMKKTILALSLFMVACGPTKDEIEQSVKDIHKQAISDTPKPYYNYIEVVTFDSCEYVHFGYGTNSWGGHKGNCKNCRKNKK